MIKECKFFKCHNKFEDIKKAGRKKVCCSQICSFKLRAYRFKCRKCGKISQGKLCKMCYQNKKGTRVNALRRYKKYHK